MSAPAALAGKKGKCPHCQSVFVVGGGAVAQPPAAAGSGGLQPLGESDLPQLDIPAASTSQPQAAPSAGLPPLSGADDLFASLPSAPQLAPQPLPAAPTPLGYTPSASPLGGTQGINPYAPPNPFSPANSYGAPSAGSSLHSARAPLKLMIPAIAMIVISVLSIGWLGYAAISGMMAPTPERYTLDNPRDAAARAGYKVGFAVGVIMWPLIGTVVNISIIAGAIQMIRLRSWESARAAAVAACLPCCSVVCLNIPFGIWALVVLYQIDVRRMFQ